jgi:hypothetical protein
MRAAKKAWRRSLVAVRRRGQPLPRVALALALVAAFGCATPYQNGANSLVGGFTEIRGPGRLVKIRFDANGYTKPDTVESYVLRRCAEWAQANRKPHFMIFGSLTAAVTDKPSYYPTVGVVDGKPSGFAFLLVLDEPLPGSQQTARVLAEQAPGATFAPVESEP